MKTSVISICTMLFAVSLSAQVQQGNVKTLGRPDKSGVALGGVTLRVKGEQNPVLSGDDGKFSFQFTNKTLGDAYTLQQVRKTGYELNDLGMIGRQLAYSDKVPLTIVMVSSSQLEEDKRRIENNAYKVAEKNYKNKLALLEKQLSDGIVTEEKYRKELGELQDKFGKFQSLINDLAEHYAHTDYDMLNEKEREINICIENGDLERADSLLHLIFNPEGVLERNIAALSHIEKNEREGRNILDQANADMAKVLRQQEKDAEYLYQLYTIAVSRFDNEKARFYIETRAELDTTNVEWQNDAGQFIFNYLADYSKALNYYKLVLNQSTDQEGEYNNWVANAYNNIGTVYDNLGEYQRAMEYHLKALNIREKVLGNEHPDVAESFNNIGSIYSEKGVLSASLLYYNKALAIFEKKLGGEHRRVAVSYNNIGSVYSDQGDYSKALEYYYKAFSIRKELFGERHPDVAESYNNIGNVYYIRGDNPKALQYHYKALVIYEKTLGKEHPKVAASYNNIGNVYEKIGDFQKALEYEYKAISIRKKILGEEHPDVAESYNNIGVVYLRQRNYTKALNYFSQSLDILVKKLGKEHPKVAASYNNIGNVYGSQGDYQKALEFCFKSLDIREKVLGKEHHDVGTSYNNIGYFYFHQKEYTKALECYFKALAIWEKVLGSNNPKTQTVKENIRCIKVIQKKAKR